MSTHTHTHTHTHTGCIMSCALIICSQVELLSKCREFDDIHLRVNEKRVLNTLNSDKCKQTVRWAMLLVLWMTDCVSCARQVSHGREDEVFRYESELVRHTTSFLTSLPESLFPYFFSLISSPSSSYWLPQPHSGYPRLPPSSGVCPHTRHSGQSTHISYFLMMITSNHIITISIQTHHTHLRWCVVVIARCVCCHCILNVLLYLLPIMSYHHRKSSDQPQDWPNVSNIINTNVGH